MGLYAPAEQRVYKLKSDRTCALQIEQWLSGLAQGLKRRRHKRALLDRSIAIKEAGELCIGADWHEYPELCLRSVVRQMGLVGRWSMATSQHKAN